MSQFLLKNKQVTINQKSCHAQGILEGERQLVVVLHVEGGMAVPWCDLGGRASLLGRGRLSSLQTAFLE